MKAATTRFRSDDTLRNGRPAITLEGDADANGAPVLMPGRFRS
jgi:hypothetical protein